MESLTSTPEKLFYSFLLLMVLSACDGTGPEPLSIGHYLIDNRTKFTLQLKADNTPFDLDVPPDTIFHFLHK